MDLKKEIDEYMEAYDTRQEAEDQKIKQSLGEPDEEGWVTVTRVGKKRGTKQEKVTSEAAESAAKKRNSEKVRRCSAENLMFTSINFDKVDVPLQELQDFYKFQVREGKVKRKLTPARSFACLLLLRYVVLSVCLVAELTDLRRKFEEDKQKVAQMKASRKFKPY